MFFVAKILFAEIQLRDNFAVTIDVFLAQVAQNAAALPDHFQQAAARMMVFLVFLQMFGEVRDARRQKRNLHFGRAGVAVMHAVFFDNLLLGFLCQHFKILLCISISCSEVRAGAASNRAKVFAVYHTRRNFASLIFIFPRCIIPAVL